MGKRNRELLELLLLAACFFYLSIAKLQWLPQRRDRSFHHRSFATVVNSLRASVIVDCKPAESPLAEIEMEREEQVSHQTTASDEYTHAALPFAVLLLRSLRIGCMCYCRAVNAVAALIVSHARVYLAGERAILLSLL